MICGFSGWVFNGVASFFLSCTLLPRGDLLVFLYTFQHGVLRLALERKSVAHMFGPIYTAPVAVRSDL